MTRDMRWLSSLRRRFGIPAPEYEARRAEHSAEIPACLAYINFNRARQRRRNRMYRDLMSITAADYVVSSLPFL